MGRGRQKAKHTKIARELKSYSPDVDYDQLERELTGHSHHDEDYSKWADYEPEASVAGEFETENQQKRA
ncbi:MAG TPA: DUF3073 domain-containing protein [Humibacter sp.]|jgi:hypothetical protein|nr:DUF3073 domain-containing protein [Humibacter sp.]